MTRYHLAATIWQEGEQYVSRCPESGVASCADTPEDALAALREAVELYLQNATALGMLADLEPALSSAHRFCSEIEVTVP